MITCSSVSVRSSSAEAKWRTPVVAVGKSSGAEFPGVGVRWTIECKCREGVKTMKGMWKILAERLYDVSQSMTGINVANCAGFLGRD